MMQLQCCLLLISFIILTMTQEFNPLDVFISEYDKQQLKIKKEMHLLKKEIKKLKNEIKKLKNEIKKKELKQSSFNDIIKDIYWYRENQLSEPFGKLLQNELTFRIKKEPIIENLKDLLMIRYQEKNIIIKYTNYVFNLDKYGLNKQTFGKDIYYENMKLIFIEFDFDRYLGNYFISEENKMIEKEKYLSELPELIKILKTNFTNATIKFKATLDFFNTNDFLLFESSDKLNSIYLLK